MKSSILIRGVVLWTAVAGLVHPLAATDADAVARTFAKAAIRIMDTDHVEYEVGVEEIFSGRELAILRTHLEHLTPIVKRAVDRQDSVWGAKLAGYFEIEAALPLLRSQLLTARLHYGWEGPDYSKLESYLADNQFQYSTAYLEAIVALTGQPIGEAIVLSAEEDAVIRRFAGDEGSEYRYWALWLGRKLGIDLRAGGG